MKKRSHKKIGPKVKIIKTQHPLFSNSLSVEFIFSGKTLKILPKEVTSLAVLLTKPLDTLELQLLISMTSSSKSLNFKDSKHLSRINNNQGVRFLFWTVSIEIGIEILEGNYVLVKITNELFKLNKL